MEWWLHALGLWLLFFLPEPGGKSHVHFFSDHESREFNLCYLKCKWFSCTLNELKCKMPAVFVCVHSVEKNSHLLSFSGGRATPVREVITTGFWEFINGGVMGLLGCVAGRPWHLRHKWEGCGFEEGWLDWWDSSLPGWSLRANCTPSVAADLWCACDW